MKYSRFEELPVWKDAIELAVLVFTLTALQALCERARSDRTSFYVYLKQCR